MTFILMWIGATALILLIATGFMTGCELMDGENPTILNREKLFSKKALGTLRTFAMIGLIFTINAYSETEDEDQQ